MRSGRKLSRRVTTVENKVPRAARELATSFGVRHTSNMANNAVAIRGCISAARAASNRRRCTSSFRSTAHGSKNDGCGAQLTKVKCAQLWNGAR
jgi:hypothetical protein